MKRKFGLLVTLIILCFTSVALLSACGKKDTDKDTDVTPTEAAAEPTEAAEATEAPAAEGPEYTKGTYEAVVGDTYVNLMALKADGTFYLSKFNDSSSLAGTYELVDGDMDYVERDGTTTGTASQYFKFSYYDGFYEECPYANDQIYGVTLTGFKTVLAFKDEPWDVSKENPVTVEEYANVDDEYATIILQHTGAYVDTINEYMEGTWAKEGNTYTLQPNDVDGTCELIVAEDGKTAEYKGIDGSAVSMERPNMPLATFAGDQLSLALYKEGVAKVLVGTSAVGEGTYTYADGTLTLTIAEADVPVTANEDGSLSVEYTFADMELTETLTVPAEEITALSAE